MKFVVIGGAGAMGSIVVKDLFEFTKPEDEIVIADYNLEKAQKSAKKYKSPKVSATFINVKDKEKASVVLQNSFVTINCVQYQLNLDVMEACLLAKSHYVDLGGLFHYTLDQLKLHSRFQSAGLMAIIGMGAAPGITNILSRIGCDELDTVKEIHTRIAGTDNTNYSYLPALPVAYSLQTILEEFSYEPAVFTKGKMTFVKPTTGNDVVSFPAPVGKVKPMYTLHSEVATLPYSFAKKGVKEVSFKIAFDDKFVEQVKFLRDFGFSSHEPISVKGTPFIPIDVVNAIAMSQSPAIAKGKVKQHEIVRAVVKGTKNKKKITYVLDCHTKGLPEWGFGIDVNTGCPPSLVAILMAENKILLTPGVFPPEVAVSPKPFIEGLKKRKMKIIIQKKSGWGFKA